jgi:uncharacterized protein YbbC (DUF1343 family)
MAVGLVAGVSGAAAPATHDPAYAARSVVRPGITVLLEDSLKLIAGKRLGLLTNQTGVDEHGTSDIDLLYRVGTTADGLAVRSGGLAVSTDQPPPPAPKLVALFSPEHGIRGTEDRTNLADGRDARTGLPVYSLYGATTLPPPDSVLDKIDVLIIDLQDLGARPWTFVASMVYAMRSAAEHHLPVLVLDRPNPITGAHVEGPVLDPSVAYAGSHSAKRAAKPTALYPIPMRHGLTMGELARFYNDVLALGADLHVIPMTGWRRTEWFDETGLPWVKPSPNMPSLASATLYPAVVLLESTNVSVGRGTGATFQHVGAPWLRADRVAALLDARKLPGVRFEVERFTPSRPTDGKYGGRTIPGIRIIVTDRDRLDTSRLGATLFWAIAKVHPDSLRVQVRGFNELFGVPAARRALLTGADPDSVIDAVRPGTISFERTTRKYLLYR